MTRSTVALLLLAAGRLLAAEPIALERLREQLSAREVGIVGSAGQTLITTGSTRSGLMPERLPQYLLRQAKTQRVVSVAEGLDEDAAAAGTAARIRAVALIPSSNFELGAQERYLVVSQALSPTLAAKLFFGALD